MLLDKPPQQKAPKANSFFRHPISLDEEQTVQWHRLQDLTQERAQLGIILPDWADVVVEETCKDERGRSSSNGIPANLENDVSVAISTVGGERDCSARRFARGLHRFCCGWLIAPRVVSGGSLVPSPVLSRYPSPTPVQTASSAEIIGASRHSEPPFPVAVEAGDVPAREKLDGDGDRRWPPRV